MKCSICKNSNIKKTIKLHDDRYGFPGYFDLYECPQCGHKHLDCNLSPNELTDLYSQYYPRKSFDVAEYQPYTEQNGFIAWLNGLKSSAFRWVPRNVRVLDIGCGFGQSLGYHAARSCDVYGVEADENIQRVVEKYGFKVHVGLFDDRLYPSDFFDCITLDQVIEHLVDPVATLHGIARILKSNGTIILSTPNSHGWVARLCGKRWINWHAPYHLQFFTRESMLHTAAQAGLVVSKVKIITSSEWLLYQWIHLVTYKPQGNPSWFWSHDKSGITLIQKTLVKLLILFHKLKINHLITRILDRLGLGDNILFILKKK